MIQCRSPQFYEQTFDPVRPPSIIEILEEVPFEQPSETQDAAEGDPSTEQDESAILASVQDKLSHLSATPPMVEFIFDTEEPSKDVPVMATQPILRLDTSVTTPVEQFYSPTYESPSQRRRRERRTSGLIQINTPSNAVAVSSVSVDVLPTPRGRRSRRPHSPNRRREGEIDILDESDEGGDQIMGFRGRQKKRPSELRCFPVNSLGPKRAYPGQTPISPGVSDTFDFRRMPASPRLHKKVAALGNENVPRVGTVVEFVSTPISPVPEDWS